MAERDIIHALKRSDVVNRPLPSSINHGEPIINTADGIMYFSGVTSSTDEWTPAGTGTTASFFEVGSNLYDLKLRNQLTEYEGISGGGLTGKFLSGTTSGFVLANISDITTDNDSYVTGGTYTATAAGAGTLDLELNNGKPTVNVTGVDNYYTTGTTLVGASIYFDRNDSLSAYTVDLSGLDINDTYLTGGTISYVDEDGTITFTNNDGGTFTVTNVTDVETTGGTISYVNEDGTITFTQNDGTTFTVANVTDTNTTGSTLTGSIATFTKNDGATYELELSALTTTDTFVTGFTYDNNNNLTISRNEGEADLTVNLSTFSAVTISSLDANSVVYTDGSGTLTTETAFAYNEATDTLTVGNIAVQNGTGDTATFGQGGVTIGSGGIGDLTIQGDLTVLGNTTTVSTSELLIEDPTITLNYSTGTTNPTSLGSGIEIQDGDGAGADLYLKVEELNTAYAAEYPATTGAGNRAFYTSLNDIVIRQATDTTSPSVGQVGKRVLAEDDILDGGTY